jgi:FKBP-type peptidyl-prolyl cis-trans isomerase FkpA/FKBP-type peptidyl-prolyl cis-trans isomerase FklB
MKSKKSLLLGTAVAASMIFGLGCEKKLDTDQRKASYAIGQQIGQNLKSQNIDFDADVLAASIKEASTGKASKLKPEEMQQALMKLQEGIQKKQGEQAEKNKAEGAAFLEKNKTQPNVKTTASGLQYVVVTEGTGKTPGPNDTVKAHYKGTLITGEQFDSSYDRGQPAEFPVSGVIKGWTEALQLMKVGGKLKLFIPSDLAYGPAPRPGIPANSVLLFEVELIDVMKTEPPAAAKPAAPAKKK